MNGVIQMQPCTFSEAFDLLEICQQEQVACSVDVNTGNLQDHVITIVDEIPSVQFEELEDGDCMTVDMGNTQFSFGVRCQFSKDIRGRQIAVAVGTENYTVWFESGRISMQGINKAKHLIKSPYCDE